MYVLKHRTEIITTLFQSSLVATLLTTGMVSVRNGVFGWNKKDAPKLQG